MTTLVLDNSVVMRWFFDSGEQSYADAILYDLASGTSDAVVPTLWSYEASAVLVRAQSSARYPEQDIREFINDLRALPIRIDPDDAIRALTAVFDLAVATGLTAYDAAYLELALRLGLPLATLDKELVRAARQTGATILGAARTPDR